jgi:hypothetical protein
MMGTLVHTCLGSSYLIAHVLHCHCGVEVTELSTNKQHTLSPSPPRTQLYNRSCSNKHTRTLSRTNTPKKAFNKCSRLTLDVLGGKSSGDYACGHKEGDNIETVYSLVCTELRNMFSYFKALRTTKSHLRYFDFCGSVLDAWGKTADSKKTLSR